MLVLVVGGFVRDQVLGMSPKDMDFVVVGATESDLHKYGQKHGFTFKQVGADFPVFLDQFGREWALARKERKTGPGYHGFETEFHPSVTLEEDLFRRDLTMNAMARRVVEFREDGTVQLGSLIDPFDGRTDINAHQINHISNHFAEDPLRILRVARFSGKFVFIVSDQTMRLMEVMVSRGDINELVPERVWAEVEKALSWDVPRPSNFFEVLDTCGALEKLFPEVRRLSLRGWTPIKEALDSCLTIRDSAAATVRNRLAVVARFMPTSDARMLCFERLKMPKKMADFVVKFTSFSHNMRIKADNLNADEFLNIFDDFDMFRDKEFLDKAEVAASAFKLDEDRLFGQIRMLKDVFALVKPVGFDDLSEEEQKTLSGPEIGTAIRKLRKEVIENN